MKIVNKVLDILGIIVRVCIAVLMLGMLVAVTMQVVARYVFHYGFSWTDEFARYCLIFVSIMGAVLVTQERKHISVSVFDSLLGKNAIWVLDLVRLAISAVFSVLVISFTRVTFDTIRGAVSTTMHIPMEIVYAVYPFSFGAMLLYQIFGIISDIYDRVKTKDAVQEGGEV